MERLNGIEKSINKPITDKFIIKIPFIIGDYQLEMNSPWIKYPILIIILSLILMYLFEPSLVSSALKEASLKLGIST